jgi:hypothetical protein
LGGFDETFTGVCYRFEAEFAYRLFRVTGRKVRFLPEAGLRHLQAGGGGTRAFGTRYTWKHISASIGDYYFAMRCLPWGKCVAHCLRRLFREPLNRSTLNRPWLIPSLYLRETVAWFRTLGRLLTRRNKYLKDAAAYSVSEPVPSPLARRQAANS